MSSTDPWTPPPDPAGAGQPPQYGTQPQYYGQPPYYGQQPGYPGGPAQGGWGQPGGYGPPVPLGTNTMAILSLVFAFVFAPAAIVLGIVAKGQIRERNEGGSGLATAGIVLGAVFTALFLLAFVGLAVGSTSAGV
ncbi:MAG: DUF4190 domain-containing protein [Frankiaceae bacterium]